jgi:hypothetical protein
VSGRSRAESQVGVRLMGVWRVSYSNIQEFFFPSELHPGSSLATGPPLRESHAVLLIGHAVPDDRPCISAPRARRLGSATGAEARLQRPARRKVKK